MFEDFGANRDAGEGGKTTGKAAIGLMAFMGIGMAEVSSCHITAKEGQQVKKGDQLGMFLLRVADTWSDPSRSHNNDSVNGELDVF